MKKPWWWVGGIFSSLAVAMGLKWVWRKWWRPPTTILQGADNYTLTQTHCSLVGSSLASQDSSLGSSSTNHGSSITVQVTSDDENEDCNQKTESLDPILLPLFPPNLAWTANLPIESRANRKGLNELSNDDLNVNQVLGVVPGLCCLTAVLPEPVLLHHLAVVYFWFDKRKVKECKVEISAGDDEMSWEQIYYNQLEETKPEGNIYSIPPPLQQDTSGRYLVKRIRLWQHGNTANSSSHWVNIQGYGSKLELKQIDVRLPDPAQPGGALISYLSVWAAYLACIWQDQKLKTCYLHERKFPNNELIIKPELIEERTSDGKLLFAAVRFRFADIATLEEKIYFKALFIAFPGTVSDLPDLLTDVDASQLRIQIDRHVIHVHSGFWKLMNKTLSFDRSACLKLMEATPNVVILCGHSIGGAVALHTALNLVLQNNRDLVSRLQVYTFGAPVSTSRSGEEIFAAYCMPLYQYVSGQDVIPLLPRVTRWLGSKQLESLKAELSKSAGICVLNQCIKDMRKSKADKTEYFSIGSQRIVRIAWVGTYKGSWVLQAANAHQIHNIPRLSISWDWVSSTPFSSLTGSGLAACHHDPYKNYYTPLRLWYSNSRREEHKIYVNL